MAKKEVREDTSAWIFAAHLYVIVAWAFVLAIGSDVRHAIQAIEKTYGS